MALFRRKRLDERDSNGDWQRDLAEQREEDRAMKREVATVLSKLDPNEPVPAATRRVFELFEQWYFTFAKRNADRLSLINANIRRMIRVITVSLFVVAVVLALVGFLSVKFTIDQSHERNARLDAIQTSRQDASYDACKLSNIRHDNAVAYIHRVLIGQLGNHPTPAQKASGEQGEKEFDTLINDLTPHRKDCHGHANQVTNLTTTTSSDTTSSAAGGRR